MRSSNRAFRLVSWLSLILVLLSCWHFWIVEIPLASVFGSVENSRKFWIIIDELLNWMLFAGLAYLLVASVPEWLKELPRNILPNRGLNKAMDQSVR
jgi:hypothetical protein